VGVVDLFKMAYALATEKDTRENAVRFLNEVGSDPKKVAESLMKEIRASFASEWDKAVKAGKETELVAKWTTMGILEVATALLAVTKAAKVTKVSKASKVAKAAESPAKGATTAGRASEAAFHGKKASRKKSWPAQGRVSPAQQKRAQELFEDWVRNYASIDHGTASKMVKLKDSSDFSKGVRIRKVRKGERMEQWVSFRDRRPGMFAARPGADPTKLGINTSERFLIGWRADRPFYVMETISKDYPVGRFVGIGGQGGEIQMVMPPDWLRYVTRIR